MNRNTTSLRQNEWNSWSGISTESSPAVKTVIAQNLFDFVLVRAGLAGRRSASCIFGPNPEPKMLRESTLRESTIDKNHRRAQSQNRNRRTAARTAQFSKESNMQFFVECPKCKLQNPPEAK